MKGCPFHLVACCLFAFPRQVDPEFVPPAEMQPIVKSGLVWAVYMGVTSNLRYTSGTPVP